MVKIVDILIIGLAYATTEVIHTLSFLQFKLIILKLFLTSFSIRMPQHELTYDCLLKLYINCDYYYY